jgi:imidazolonepropionase-like amidohydrolase
VTNAREQLGAGVTTVRDLGSNWDIAITVARAVDRGVCEGPTVIASGRTVVMTGGHDPFWGIFSDGVDAVTRAVRQQVSAGAGVIKTAATGGVYGRPEGEAVGQSELSREELTALAAEAHRFGLRTAAHALGTEGIRNAVLAGVDTIEHGIFLTEEIVAAMRDRGTVLCPTLVTYRTLAEDPQGAIPDYAVAKARTVVDGHRESFAMALDAGVPMVAGTDAGACQLPHPALVDELLIMHEYGMPTAQALRTATAGAASALGRDDELGVVLPGARGDLVIIEEDPLADLSSLRRVWGVVRAGRGLGDMLAPRRRERLPG